MSESLKPCPFCGGRADFVKIKVGKIIKKTGYFVKCRSCRASTGAHLTAEEAIAAWNTRKPMELIVEQLEELDGKYGERFVNSHIITNDAIEIVQKGGA